MLPLSCSATFLWNSSKSAWKNYSIIMSNQKINIPTRTALATSLKEILTNNWVPKYLCLLLAITVWGVVLFSTTSRESGWESDDVSVASPDHTQVKSERTPDAERYNAPGQQASQPSSVQ